MPQRNMQMPVSTNTSQFMAQTPALLRLARVGRWTAPEEQVFQSLQPARSSRSAQLATLRSDQWTTLVFKRMPKGSTRETLCGLLNGAGFAARYDFVYIPVSYKTWSFFGYAFVNFVQHSDAFHCLEVFRQMDMEMEVYWCEEHQGLLKHIERYRNNPIMHADVPDDYKPILLANGMRVPFPAPTKSIRAPRSLGKLQCDE